MSGLTWLWRTNTTAAGASSGLTYPGQRRTRRGAGPATTPRPRDVALEGAAARLVFDLGPGVVRDRGQFQVQVVHGVPLLASSRWPTCPSTAPAPRLSWWTPRRARRTIASKKSAVGRKNSPLVTRSRSQGSGCSCPVGWASLPRATEGGSGLPVVDRTSVTALANPNSPPSPGERRSRPPGSADDGR